MVSATKKDIWAKFGVVSKLFFVSKFVFSTFFYFDSFIFCTIAYYDRGYWYLADPGGYKYQKNIWAKFGAVSKLFFVSKFIFRLFYWGIWSVYRGNFPKYSMLPNIYLKTLFQCFFVTILLCFMLSFIFLLYSITLFFL